MGLISKEIEIALCNTNYKHFEKLGYKIPMKLSSESTYRRYGNRYVVNKGEKIIANVKDSKETSKVKVLIKCDCCGKEYKIEWSVYLKHNHDGKTYCNKCKSKVFLSGDKSWNWNFNKTEKERIEGRLYPEYKRFIKSITARDNYTCQCCDKKDHNLNVHHLDGYDWCVDKRTDETNGITLCETCHSNFHSIYGKGNNTKEQFEEWIGYAIGELEKYNGELPTARKVYCIEEDKVYDSVKEICEEWNHGSEASVYSVCNHKINKRKDNKGKIVEYECKTIQGKHLLWYNEYISMSKEELENFCKINNQIYKTRKVICLTTNEIFDSIRQADRYYNIHGVAHCCLGISNYSGILEDGTKLRWAYYDGGEN